MRICRAARFLSRRSRGMPRYDECCNHEHIMRTLTCARAFRVSTLGILLRFERNDSFGAGTTSLRWSPRSLPPSACPPLPLLQPVSMRQPSSTPPAASTLAVALEEAPAAALEINGGSGCQGGEAEMRTHVIKLVEQ